MIDDLGLLALTVFALALIAVAAVLITQIVRQPLTFDQSSIPKGQVMPKIPDKTRMIAWIAVGTALYLASFALGQSLPALQTILYKLGHVTTLSWVGYWISRNAIGRVDAGTPPQEKIARAILIAGVILAGSMGL